MFHLPVRNSRYSLISLQRAVASVLHAQCVVIDGCIKIALFDNHRMLFISAVVQVNLQVSQAVSSYNIGLRTPGTVAIIWFVWCERNPAYAVIAVYP